MASLRKLSLTIEGLEALNPGESGNGSAKLRRAGESSANRLPQNRLAREVCRARRGVKMAERMGFEPTRSF
ncbi:hypothetical protein MPL3356_680001 [Mesorhizobium plurifarium]|uniref:Uncharacterized protein n=1 Tax=Mesorhizobium plurifarium TaxID=69974 RepID=A0A090G8W4_MESPL|nr:hypothetical protein MPL3356_680001 [Mesorhizobium plurifarium]